MPRYIEKKCENPLCDYYGRMRADCKYHSRECYKQWLSLENAYNVGVNVIEPEVVVKGDCMVCNDLHIPYTDPYMLTMLEQIAKSFGITTLAIGGDILNADGLKFADTSTDIILEKQLEASEKIFGALSRQFTTIFACLGNHDERVRKALGGALSADQYGKLITPAKFNSDLIITNQRFLLIESEGNVFRYTHPGSYSRNAPTVERKLAEKFGCHVLSTHGHMFALGFDTSGQKVVCQLGCMCRHDTIPYAAMTDTTHPSWNLGFGMILRGHLYPFAEGLTDWSFWI